MLELLQGEMGIPKLFMYHNGATNHYLVMQLLGKSIERLFEFSNKNFPVQTVIKVIIQMVKRVEYLHSRHLIHRDIKPDNFLIGRTKEDSETIYLVDYGFSRYFEDRNTLVHIPYKIGKNMTGTARFASIFSLLCAEQSRKDDLESICYILIYLSKGTLPWQGIKSKNKKERHFKIRDSKLSITPEELCIGLPEEYLKFLHYIKGLQFTDKPNYNYLHSLLTNVWKRVESLDIIIVKIDWNRSKTSQTDDEVILNHEKAIKDDMLRKTVNK